MSSTHPELKLHYGQFSGEWSAVRTTTDGVITDKWPFGQGSQNKLRVYAEPFHEGDSNKDPILCAELLRRTTEPDFPSATFAIGANQRARDEQAALPSPAAITAAPKGEEPTAR